MEEIIVIRAADPDGSVFKAVVDALRGKRAEVVSVAAPVSSMLRIGELEIYHEQKRVIMAGREVQLNHGEYAMLYCFTAWPAPQGRYSPRHNFMQRLGERSICMGQTPWRISSGA